MPRSSGVSQYKKTRSGQEGYRASFWAHSFEIAPIMWPYPTLNLQLNVELGLVGPMHDTLPPLLTRGVSITLWPCPLTLKSILRQNKNYGNSNISPCKNIPNLQKNPLKETKILQDIITM
jgi:hypothetical protein